MHEHMRHIHPTASKVPAENSWLWFFVLEAGDNKGAIVAQSVDKQIAKQKYRQGPLVQILQVGINTYIYGHYWQNAAHRGHERGVKGQRYP